VGRTDDDHVRLALEPAIVEIVTATGDEARVFTPPGRGTDSDDFHGSISRSDRARSKCSLAQEGACDCQDLNLAVERLPDCQSHLGDLLPLGHPPQLFIATIT
jgi:hypothetical protein